MGGLCFGWEVEHESHNWGYYCEAASAVDGVVDFWGVGVKGMRGGERDFWFRRFRENGRGKMGRAIEFGF